MNSYSAFNYNTAILQDVTDTLIGIDAYDENKLEPNINRLQRYYEKHISTNITYSTGLWEFIINSINGAEHNLLNITVCGLFGDRSVIDTVVHGIHTWQTFYKESNKHIGNVVFNYDISGTLFSTNYPELFEKDLYDENTFTENIQKSFCNLVTDLLPKLDLSISFNVICGDVQLCIYKNPPDERDITILAKYKNSFDKYIKYKSKYLNILNK